MARICSTYGETRKNLGHKRQEKNMFGIYLGICGRTILKWILEKWDVEVWVELN
jgi:hypothetical protein